VQADKPKTAPKTVSQTVRTLRERILLRPRLPVWRLRLAFGLLMLAFSEMVAWQNPPARQWFEWPLLVILYTCVGAFFLDVAVRFSARSPAAIGMACGVYGLIVSAVFHHTAYVSFPFGLLLRGLGLQVGMGFLGLMAFILVIRGRQLEPLHLVGAVLTGAAWGIWIHWFPLQETANWGLVTLESAQLWLIVPLVVAGAAFELLVPRFGTVREPQIALTWWEAILFGAPLFFALLIGLLTNAIPALQLLLPAGIGAYCVWALRFQAAENEPSILAEITFAAPNLITYVILVGILLLVGSVSYGLVSGPDSPFGVAVYFIVLGFGTAWLPFASGLMFWTVLRTDYPARRKARNKANKR
jgi:hypothetical protein